MTGQTGRKESAPLSWMEVSRSALKQNLRLLRMRAGGRVIAASVKANAYGHGLEQIVQLLRKDGSVDYLAVHAIEEAMRARSAGWDKSIMLLGPTAPEAVPSVFALNCEPVIFSLPILKLLAAHARKTGTPLRTHLKLETGTHRLGITERELPAFARVYLRSPLLQRPYGASTHFANIEDTTSHEYADFQLANFERLLGMMKKLGIEPTIRHTASSAALLLFDKTHFDLVRPGISLYGHWPSKETYVSYRSASTSKAALRPVLAWRTRVGQLKTVAANSFVGYGCTYRTTKRTKLAILPVGYFDGYPRGLSNQSYVLIRGKRAPVRGRICMNLMMVDVTDIPKVQLHDTVTLLGRDGREEMTAEQLAAMAGTINYELLARLSSETTRIVVA